MTTDKETRYEAQLRKLKESIERATLEHAVLKRTVHLEEPENPQARAGLMMHRLRTQRNNLVSDMAGILSEIQKITF